MKFQEKFELDQLHGHADEIAWSGRELSTGRRVVCHLLTGGLPADGRAVAERALSLPPEHAIHVITSGEHERIPFVVTGELPGGLSLRGWLASLPQPPADPPAAPRDSSVELGRGGIWKIPELPPPDEKPAPAPTAGEMPTVEMLRPVAEPPLPAPQHEPGEFTRLLQRQPAEAEIGATSQGPATEIPTVEMPMPPASTAETRPMPELTQPLQPQATEPETPTLELPRPAYAPAAEVRAAPPASGDGPGEFTRMLQRDSVLPGSPTPGPQKEVAVAPQHTPDGSQIGPGEFTRFMQSPVANSPSPAQPQREAVPSSPEVPGAPSRPLPEVAPGEFTRMMQSPLAPGRSTPAAPAQPARPADEFGRMLEGHQAFPLRPGAGPSFSGAPVPQASQQGEFTQLFNAPPVEDRAPAAPSAPLPGGGLATGAFARPSRSNSAPVAAGPSEFTRMIAVPRQAAPPPQPQAAATGTPAARAKKSLLPLMVGLGLLLLAAAIVVLIAAIKG